MSAPERRAARDQGAVRVLYVGGMPRSGSTLLTWMAGQLEGHVAVGELFYLWSAGLRRDQLCGCGSTFRACPFWTSVGESAFGGWDEVDLEEVERLRDAVDRTSRLPALAAAAWRPGLRRDAEAYVSLMERVYRAAAEASASTTVVDGSKRPSLAFLLGRSPMVDLRVVQIVRDPRGVVHSWSKQVELPEGAGVRGFLKVRSTRLITRRWVTVNALTRGLARFGVPVLTVRYEDLVSDPHLVLVAIAEFSGLSADPDPAGFVDGSEVHLQHSHMVEGGRVRFSPSPLTMRLDEAWRTEMPTRRRRTVELVTTLSRRRYGY